MNPSYFIFRFHFDLNLKDSHRRIFWVILMGLSKVVDFITVSVCFLQLACVEVKAQEAHATCGKIFAVVRTEKKRQGKRAILDLEVWPCQVVSTT